MFDCSNKRICPEKINSLKTISLSARIVVQNADYIQSNINNKLKDKTNDSKRFFLAHDELTDVNDTGQLLLPIRGINAKFEVTEELASKNSLYGALQVRIVEKTLIQYNPEWNLLRCVIANDMSGKKYVWSRKRLSWANLQNL